MPFLLRRIRLIALINFVIFAGGTLGYVLLEGWSLGDAMYMTIITVGSVGYGEVRDLSAIGRIFTGILILFGVGSVAVSFTLLVESVFTDEFRHDLWERRMEKKLEKLQDHVIVCGYGRVGRNAIDAINQENRRDIVVIDQSHDRFDHSQDNFLAVEGDATEDATLKRAGIERAWGLLVATGSDSVNLFVTLSARALNPNLTIVARSSNEENNDKMTRAGANRVVSPYDIGGQRMAHSLMRPHLTEFLDVLTTDSGMELFLEELNVADASGLLGRTLSDVDLRNKTGVTLLAVLRPEGVVTPNADFKFSSKDALIVIGTRQQLDALEALIT